MRVLPFVDVQADDVRAARAKAVEVVDELDAEMIEWVSMIAGYTDPITGAVHGPDTWRVFFDPSTTMVDACA